MMEPEVNPVGTHDALSLKADDRRHEPRFKASGQVFLILEEPQSLAIPGRIIDQSDHGMRVEHMYAALNSGVLVQIDSGAGKYTARVVWTRIKDDGVESGFYLF